MVRGGGHDGRVVERCVDLLVSRCGPGQQCDDGVEQSRDVASHRPIGSVAMKRLAAVTLSQPTTIGSRERRSVSSTADRSAPCATAVTP